MPQISTVIQPHAVFPVAIFVLLYPRFQIMQTREYVNTIISIMTVDITLSKPNALKVNNKTGNFILSISAIHEYVVSENIALYLQKGRAT
jgi:hypothetical protein